MRSALPQDRLQREILLQGPSTVTQPSGGLRLASTVLPSCLLFSPGHEEQAQFKPKISVLKVFPTHENEEGSFPEAPGDKYLTACESQSLAKQWLGFLVLWSSLALSVPRIPPPGSLGRSFQPRLPSSAPLD